jgi:hypothetical protein
MGEHMNKFRGFMKKYWKLVSVCVSFALVGTLLGVSIAPVYLAFAIIIAISLLLLMYLASYSNGSPN